MSYSIKPWGRAALVGNTAASLVLGIGMRWRETVTELIEQRPGPDYENFELRRCVLSQNSLQILQDVGVTAGALDRERHLSRAGMWRFLTDDGLDVIREGSSYPGCAPAEATYHIAYGGLVRALRREYVRFGGSIHWGARAGAPFLMSDGSGFWGMQKEFGPVNEVECVVGTSQAHTDCAYHLFGEDAWKSRPMIKFPTTHGWCLASDLPEPGLSRCFPASNDVDFVIVLGKGCALHMWKTFPLNQRIQTTPIISWRLVSHPTSSEQEQSSLSPEQGQEEGGAAKFSPPHQRQNSNLMFTTLHPNLRQMFAKSRDVVHDMSCVPTASCSLKDDETNMSRVTLVGDALLPVDPFEFRGDRALISIEDSAALCRRMFKEKYYRGFVPVDFREHEMDSIARRTKLIQRDLGDAEVFLNASEQIAENQKKAESIEASS